MPTLDNFDKWLMSYQESGVVLGESLHGYHYDADDMHQAFLAGASVGEKHGRRNGYLSALNAASTVTPDDRFNDLISREDYGDREQLKRFFRVGIQVGEARERQRVLEIVSETRPEYQRRYSSDANECLDGVERRITEATTEPRD